MKFRAYSLYEGHPLRRTHVIALRCCYGALCLIRDFVALEHAVDFVPSEPKPATRKHRFDNGKELTQVFTRPTIGGKGLIEEQFELLVRHLSRSEPLVTQDVIF